MLDLSKLLHGSVKVDTRISKLLHGFVKIDIWIFSCPGRMFANSIPARLVATRMRVALRRARACHCHAHAMIWQ